MAKKLTILPRRGVWPPHRKCPAGVERGSVSGMRLQRFHELSDTGAETAEWFFHQEKATLKKPESAREL